MAVILRSASSADIPALMALELQCPMAAHWTEVQYRHLFEDEEPGKASRRLALAVEEEAPKALIGFLVAHNLGKEWEIENIVVAPAARRKGLARQMLQELFKRASETGSHAIFLEVRESNQPAQGFYRALGFIRSGRRKNYYPKPLEDAILYRRSLP